MRELVQLRGGEQARVRGVIEQEETFAALVVSDAGCACACTAACLHGEATHGADGVDKGENEQGAPEIWNIKDFILVYIWVVQLKHVTCAVLEMRTACAYYAVYSMSEDENIK